MSVRWCVAPATASTPDDLLSFCGALLFALLAMRQLWPAAPPGSTMLDALCIFPQLLLVSFGILLLLTKNLLSVREEPPPAAANGTGLGEDACCYTFT